MQEQHGGAGELALELLKPVSREIPRQDAGGGCTRGEALEHLPGDQRQRRNENQRPASAVAPVEQPHVDGQNRRQENRLVGGQRGQRHAHCRPGQREGRRGAGTRAAASALMPTLGSSSRTSVETSLDAAGTSACATEGGPPHTKSAIAAIHNARKGRSASSELPFTTNAGVATNSSAAHSGRGENRRARLHMAHAATIEKTIYAAWKESPSLPRRLL